MASERMRYAALTALMAIAVYLLDVLMAARVGEAMARLVVLGGALAIAVVAPLGHQRARPAWRPWVEALRAELAVQTSAQGVAGVLVKTLRRQAGAGAVCLYLGEREPAAMSGEPKGEPSLCMPLPSPEGPIGEIRCYGPIRSEAMVERILRVGALALRNALLAEQAAVAEHSHLQARAQRDLQYRLTWTVTTKLRALLEETREHLETVRLCARSMPPDLLGRDLERLTDRLRQLEAFVHDSLRIANSGEVPVSKPSLARFSRPR